MMRGLLLLFLLLLACNPQTGPQAVEVRDYHGQKLSSSDDFRENSIKGPQRVDIVSYRLAINGLVENPLELTYDEIKSYPATEKIVTLYCVEGWDATILWKGVQMNTILEKAKVKEGANTIVFYAYDGYTTSLPLDYVKDKNIILAYDMNNRTMPIERGFPFQLVAEDKWGYKWIKWVTRIEITDDPGYKGYWESRGYNNDGNHSGPIYAKG
jgi:DMSO/TMAO reductase YedYZ molybdopterin-dependent catalytic subunit